MAFTQERNINLAEYETFQPMVFKKESDLCDKIEANIEHFTKQLFEEEYISHEREFNLKGCEFGKGVLRVDFLIKTLKGEYMCEVKNPTHFAELRNGIGQLLHYRLFRPDSKLCLITTEYKDYIREMISEFKLPIDVFVLRKDTLLKMI